ncbi:three-helix bundle dimerization domain-containing protein [Mycobacteroides salmoniphilum]|uniref:three-helix bundle dimerization domain-containing protein n=1 Tax=Mycobacteroides salmoniphilum TaxID=404941 RepID=UPI003999D149
MSPEHVSAVVQGAYAQFADCRVREFVPLLVERRARRALVEAGSSSAVTAEGTTACPA